MTSTDVIVGLPGPNDKCQRTRITYARIEPLEHIDTVDQNEVKHERRPSPSIHPVTH